MAIHEDTRCCVWMQPHLTTYNQLVRTAWHATYINGSGSGGDAAHAADRSERPGSRARVRGSCLLSVVKAAGPSRTRAVGGGRLSYHLIELDPHGRLQTRASRISLGRTRTR